MVVSRSRLTVNTPATTTDAREWSRDSSRSNLTRRRSRRIRSGDVIKHISGSGLPSAVLLSKLEKDIVLTLLWGLSAQMTTALDITVEDDLGGPGSRFKRP